ncbi:hypothetical protein PF002_g26623 [Phytophthora fragariae]|uniref:Uncharacterized protein n=1 Tax=Phytophthora fragariae TaxID=53985 RepID=A0A6A3WEM9_9STRA|nr:hypothetical protein PF011_g24210 [Phytophthora fragariae]KAE9183743.1 hypothetical protein PF002_g26623 [Phytophthora fragariae]
MSGGEWHDGGEKNGEGKGYDAKARAKANGKVGVKDMADAKRGLEFQTFVKA